MAFLTVVFSLLLLLGSIQAQQKAICQPENANIEVYEGEDAVLKVTCDQDVSVTLIAFCNGITAKFPDDLSPSFHMIGITGMSGSTTVKTVLDKDCSEGNEVATCFLAGGGANVFVGGLWTITIKECPCGKKWGDGRTCEEPDPKPLGCYEACPDGQIYSTDQKRCFVKVDCPKKSGGGSGDPHYTTFDGYYYTIFDHCSHVSAEDCQDQRWSVYQITSNRCSGGRAPTCIDGVMVRLKRTNTIVHYSYITRTVKFIGNKPSTDDILVSFNGYSFTAYLVKEDVTAYYSPYYLTVTVGSQWVGPGRVCGLFGTPDNNRNNEWMLRDGTVLGSYTDPRFEMEYRADNITGVCPKPIPPEPVPHCSGSALTTALAFCRAMSDPAGSYASCHATFPPGDTYEEPVDAPFEQCVYDHCVLGSQSGCSDVLKYADQCREAGHRVGDPPNVCLPTCPNGFIYKGCGPKVSPSCDMPAGVDGCVAGCFCPEGELVSPGGQCVTECPAPVNFDRPTYYAREENGGVCVKLTRKGSVATDYSITLALSRRLSTDASGPVGECLGCTSVPGMCGGNTQCRLTFPTNHSERCVWLKIDNDDSPSEDIEVTLNISGGQNNDKAKVLVHDDTDGNCLQFTSRVHRIQESKRLVDIGLQLTKNVSDVFWGEVSTREGTASACSDFQSGRYEVCFAASLTSSVTVPVVKDRETEGFECFSQSIEPLGDGEDYDPPVVPCFPKYSLTIIADDNSDIPVKGDKYKCFNRETNTDEVCTNNTDVVRVTVLDEAQPEDCYLGYNIEVQHIYKGSLSQGEKTVLRVLPVDRCPDPTFDYGADYLVAGDVVDGDLVVEGKGVVLDHPAYTRLNLPNLCP